MTREELHAIALTPCEIEQLNAFVRYGLTAAGDTLSHSLGNRLVELRLACRISGYYSPTTAGNEWLAALREKLK